MLQGDLTKTIYPEEGMSGIARLSEAVNMLIMIMISDESVDADTPAKELLEVLRQLDSEPVDGHDQAAAVDAVSAWAVI